MLNLNIEKGNSQFLAAQNSPSNTPLFLHDTPSPSPYSFNSFSSSPNQAQIEIKVLLFHLDYLRLTSNGLTKTAFDSLVAYLGLPIPCFENKIAWHPDPKTPKSKQYQNKLESKKGITLGYTKRLLNQSKKPKYVYDIMADIPGAYFANLSLVEQINIICYLNSNWQLKCHRIDVAMDDYSRRLFPVIQILDAFSRGYNFGFKVIDTRYLNIIDNQFTGTLGIGSRRSSLFVRIYTKHQDFVRWETELKQKKSQELFDKLVALGNNKVSSELPVKDILQALADAALDNIDFRDKSCTIHPKNATRARTNRLPFWSDFLTNVSLLVEIQAELHKSHSRNR